MKNRMEFNLVAIYIGFWFFWFAYSFVSGYNLEDTTVWVVLISFTGFLIGWISRGNKYKIEKRTYSSEIKLIYFLNISIILYGAILILSVYSIYSIGFEHRDLTFSDEGVLGNVFATFIQKNIVQPFVFAAVVISVAAKNREFNYSFYTYGLLGAMAVISLGRFPLYYMIYIYFVDLLLSSSGRAKYFKFLMIASVILLISWLILSNKLNNSASNGAVFDVIRIYALNYHIVGYHSLDYFISSNSLNSSNFVFPSTSLGSLGWYIHLITKYSEILPVFPNSYMELLKVFNEGIYFDKLNWYYNAFTTNILPMYADGGVAGVFIGFFIYGLISKSGSNLDCFRINPIFLLTIFLMTFSLFQPLTHNTLPLSLAFIWLLEKILIREYRL